MFVTELLILPSPASISSVISPFFLLHIIDWLQVEESLGESGEVVLPLSDLDSLTDPGLAEYRPLLPADDQPPGGRSKDGRQQAADAALAGKDHGVFLHC